MRRPNYNGLGKADNFRRAVPRVPGVLEHLVVRVRERHRRGDGFGQADLLALVAGVCLLAALVWAPVALARERSRLATCHRNLHQVSRALTMYAGDQGGRLPGPTVGQPGDVW